MNILSTILDPAQVKSEEQLKEFIKLLCNPYNQSRVIVMNFVMAKDIDPESLFNITFYAPKM